MPDDVLEHILPIELHAHRDHLPRPVRIHMLELHAVGRLQRIGSMRRRVAVRAQSLPGDLRAHEACAMASWSAQESASTRGSGWARTIITGHEMARTMRSARERDHRRRSRA